MRYMLWLAPSHIPLRAVARLENPVEIVNCWTKNWGGGGAQASRLRQPCPYLEDGEPLAVNISMQTPRQKHADMLVEIHR